MVGERIKRLGRGHGFVLANRVGGVVHKGQENSVGR